MNTKKLIFSILTLSLLTFMLCSCSKSSMRNGNDVKKDAEREIDNALRNGENVVDYGMGALENGANDVTGNGYYRGGLGFNDGFGANDGYSGYVGNGTGSSVSTTGTDGGIELFPTAGDDSRDNIGQINTTNGSADGGMGDIYKDTDFNRNSLRTDKLDKKYVK